jgi:CBS domain-containing protein
MAVDDKSKNGFEDPLENYDAATFDDPVEQALHDASVSEVQMKPHLCVSADTPIREAMKLMAGRQIACVLVEKDDKLVGVFSDRDVLERVALEYDDVIDKPVSSVMSTDTVFVRTDDSAAKVLSVMAISGYRHVPVVEGDQKPVGIVSPHRIAHFLKSHLS